MRGGREGFTLVELMMVVLLVGIMATIAAPNMTRAITKARATDVLGNLNTIKVAVLNYQSDNNVWPDDANAGQVPDGLGEYLPAGFSFTTEHYDLDYDNLSDAPSGYVGVTVVTGDRQLGLEFLELVGANAWTDNDDEYTWVIEWTD